MGNLNENKAPVEFVQDIAQIETTDSVLGGPAGPPNQPNLELAARTWWLKNTLDTLLGGFSTHEANTSNPHQVTKTQVGLSEIPNAVSDSVSLASSLTLATSKAVKTAYDKAVEAFNIATEALNKANTAITESLADARYVRRSEVSNSVTSTSQTNVGSSLAVKTAHDKALEAIEIATGNEGATDAYVLKTSVKHSVNSTSQTDVGSSLAVKTAHDKAVSAETIANSKLALSTADGRYIRLSHRSSSVVSNSATTVATSGAVKQAYDKAVAASFPKGTRMLFVQAYAPVGWVRVTTHNNKALRIVSGTGGGSGGSQSFTNALRNQTISGTTNNRTAGGTVNVNNHTLSEAQMPHHGHPFYTGVGEKTVRSGRPANAETGTNYHLSLTLGVGGSQGHNHTATFAGRAHNHTFSTSLNLAVQYVDSIICEKK